MQLDQNAQSRLRRSSHRNSPFPQVAAPRNSKKTTKMGEFSLVWLWPCGARNLGAKNEMGNGYHRFQFLFWKKSKNPGGLSFFLAFFPSVAWGKNIWPWPSYVPQTGKLSRTTPPWIIRLHLHNSLRVIWISYLLSLTESKPLPATKIENSQLETLQQMAQKLLYRFEHNNHSWYT